MTCKRCLKFYIGITQNEIKKRFTQHYCSVKTMLETGESKTRFSRHFSRCYKEEYGTDKYDVNKIRKLCRHEILYEGNTISVNKLYGTTDCRLCAEEKFMIWEECDRNFHYILNKRNEIYGTCAHNVHFHHFYRGTDESTGRDEKEN